VTAPTEFGIMATPEAPDPTTEVFGTERSGPAILQLCQRVDDWSCAKLKTKRDSNGFHISGNAQ